jgi:hypothetical protein
MCMLVLHSRGRGATGKRDIVPVRAPEDELPRRRKPSEVDFEADTASPTAARGRGGRQGAGRGQGNRGFRAKECI